MSLKGTNIFNLSPQKKINKLYNFDPADGVNTKVSVNESQGYIEYGAADSFPQFLLDSVRGSHTASACIDTIISFIQGDGFTDTSLNNIQVNPVQDWQSLHSGVSQDEGYYEGFYLNIRYNPQGLISYINKLPFENCRLGEPCEETGLIKTIHYNPYYGTADYKREETVVFPVFNPNLALEQMETAIELEQKYLGQVLFIKEERPDNKWYPIPYYWSGFRWFDVERKVGEFHNTNLDNNFFSPGILKIVGDPQEVIEEHKNKDGDVIRTVTAGDSFNKMMSDYFSGSENAGKFMVLWSELKDQFPEVEAFPANTNDQLFVTLQNLAVDNIVIACSVPPILGNIQVSGKLGNTQEITNSVALMHGRVSRKQSKLERVYQKLYNISIWNQGAIFNIDPFEYDLKEFGAEEIVVEESTNDTPRENG
jgi:hypothetical protein